MEGQNCERKIGDYGIESWNYETKVIIIRFKVKIVKEKVIVMRWKEEIMKEKVIIMVKKVKIMRLK